ncbi:hypothetical protein GCM10009799_04840 [Nocardiopsis rhodophaea]|uniref:HTH luxR-type domain-containing protein n=1 Tax=Nocardiopsis rhodophaea TaxID=280238 RepID=A0ABN2S9C8_9ACTN
MFCPNTVTNALNQHASPLTSREAEILRLAAAGEPPESIAADLALAVGTVRNYLRACTTKLSARNCTDAIRIASENGWI